MRLYCSTIDDTVYLYKRSLLVLREDEIPLLIETDLQNCRGLVA